MNDNDPAKPLSELLDAGTTLMVGTRSGGELHFRPLTVAGLRDSSIDILLDTDEDWVKDLADGDDVHVTMSDTRSNTWLELQGHATTSTDPTLIDELWNPFAEAYFDDGRDTPGIAVMTIAGTEGRYWSTSSGRLGGLISVLKAKLGSPEDSGQHGDIDV